MGLFRRWFGGSEGKSGEALAASAPPGTLEQPGPRNTVSGARSDGEAGEDFQTRMKVQSLLDTAINPAVAGHGGVVSLIDVKDNKVYLQMGGGCQGCGAADITLKAGIERMIKEEIPEIEEVLDTTDHSAGSNPYYTPGK